jgi:ribose transport system ATP-binding protein
MNIPALEFDSISKAFVGVPVLKGISFALSEGHTLGLVGENGAGKSTLMNILGGNHRPDAGQMRLCGESFAPRNPQDATRHRVAFIHQELNLFTNLTIAENLFLTDFPTIGWLPIINHGSLSQRAATLLAGVGLDASPDTLVEKLSAGEQQLVEIAKALSIEARIIIFDEPTTSLTDQETERLFALIGLLRGKGLSLIYISHHLDHVLRLCDDIVVLRDGALISNGPRSDFDSDRLISLMVGRSITQVFPPRSSTPAPQPLLQVQALSQPGIIADITFTLRRGEVLGLSGLMGSGRSELARILFGLDPFAQGQILLEGKPLNPAPRQNIRRGLAFLTENRRDEGLCLEASIADNVALVTLPKAASGPLGWLDQASINQDVDQIRRAVRLTPTALDAAKVKTLSGGNQQKVVLAKWLLAQPSVFILDEPTRGIDVGAKFEIYQLINDMTARGAGVLVISSEIEELIGLCDRILVMSRGEITDELKREEFDRERILSSALGGRRGG